MVISAYGVSFLNDWLGVNTFDFFQSFDIKGLVLFVSGFPYPLFFILGRGTLQPVFLADTGSMRVSVVASGYGKSGAIGISRSR
jgi:hypothetical protein